MDTLIALAWAASATCGCILLYGELRQANARLLLAWKDGYAIPEIVAERPDKGKTPGPTDWREEYPEPIANWLEQWEGKEARDMWGRRAKALLAKYNQNVQKTLIELDAPTW